MTVCNVHTIIIVFIVRIVQVTLLRLHYISAVMFAIVLLEC